VNKVSWSKIFGENKNKIAKKEKFMVDKARNNVYIYHSPATDITGTKLAEALGCQHGSTKPNTKGIDLVLGWGAKTSDPVNLGKVQVLNHPDRIRDNRNKFKALGIMQSAGVSVAPFVDADHIADIGKAKSKVQFPVVGRRNFHQGGKGFWLCPTMSQVKAALSVEKGAQYFQNLIEIRDEFRVHIMDGEAIHVVKKTQRTQEEFKAAWIEDELNRQKSLAAKNGDAFDDATASLMLRRQADKIVADGANQLVRSNKMGWKFVRVKSPSKALVTEAAKACKALGLNFGAVDCCTDTNDKVFVIEVNTGPGLEGTAFDAYSGAFAKLIDGMLKPKTLVEKMTSKVSGKSKGLAAAADAAVKNGAKADLQTRLRLAADMADKATDEEAEVLNRVFAKMFDA
jgi:glutathione synthase/RimK-type ligase-like ATP-grasp enzyme